MIAIGHQCYKASFLAPSDILAWSDIFWVELDTAMKHRIESMSEIAIQEQMTKTGQVGMG
jgi:hypothetical protein